MPTGVPEPASPAYDEDRQVLLAYLTDFAREFNDRASLKTSTTRAVHLLAQSGLTRPAYIAKLYEARAITKERSAAIRSTTTSPGFPLPVKAKMAYFFACLEQLLGLRPDEDDADGDDQGENSPATAQEGAKTGRDAARRPSGPPGPMAAKTTSLGGRYHRLVEQ